MGLLLVGVLAGILIGFAWLAPSGHLERCTFQWQGCFDRTRVGPVLSESGLPNSGTPKPQLDFDTRARASRTSAENSSAKPSTAPAPRRAFLAREAVQPRRHNVPAAERRSAETSDPVLERAKASVAAKMENPPSAEFSDMDRAFRKNTFGRATDTICGHVRGKTASGSDTGERPFLYLVKEDDAYVVDGKQDSAAAIAYRNICN